MDFQLLEEENDNDDDFLSEPTVTFELTAEETHKQVAAAMGHSNVWNSHPKNYGPGSRVCRVCGNSHGLIRKYGLMCCRQCFRSNAKDIGFIKYR